MRDTRQWGVVFDSRWRLVYATDDYRLLGGGGVELTPAPLGVPFFGPEATAKRLGARFGWNTPEDERGLFAALGSLVLADTPGGRDELRGVVDPMFHDLVDELSPTHPAAALSYVVTGTGSAMDRVELPMLVWRVRDGTGQLAGTAMVLKPAAGMSAVGAMVLMADVRHLERMLSVSKAGRRPAAVLFADLEASALLARRLSTASYFALGRRLVRAADRCITDAVGRVAGDVGDSVGALFLDRPAGRDCITAARALRTGSADVASRSDVQPEDVVLRFGLHWGSNLYVGNIATSGRAEVAALGDAVNEAARIEACATGGLALASKD